MEEESDNSRLSEGQTQAAFYLYVSKIKNLERAIVKYRAEHLRDLLTGKKNGKAIPCLYAHKKAIQVKLKWMGQPNVIKRLK